MGIKRIISEEIDYFEWASGEGDYNYLIKEFLETKDGTRRDKTKTNTKYLYRKLDQWDFSVYGLEGDAKEMVSFGKDVANDDLTVKDRLNNIDGFEDYASIGHMIEDAREGLYFFQPLLGEYPKLTFNKCCEITKKFLEDNGLN